MKLIITINGETRVLDLPEALWKAVERSVEETTVVLKVERDKKTKEVVGFE